MPDIFLSYSRDDQSTAKRFAEGFERAGFTVWWDQTLNAGEAYDEVTEKALQEAKAVVVLWSKKSVVSRWVRAEATQADRNKNLVPAMIEACTRPIMFELTQTSDLSHWNGDPGDKVWQSYVASVRRYVQKGSPVAPPTPAPETLQRARGGTRPLFLAIAVALLLVAGAGVWILTRTPAPAAGAQATPQAGKAEAAPVSLAVLPFVNLSSDKEQEYFSDGLSEELLNQLSQVEQLRVIGRASSFAFKGRNEDLRHIGETLGVNHLLEGSVRKAGNRVLITAQLINSADGSNVWSKTYERTLDDIFAIQDEIARAVVGELKLQLGKQTLNGSGTKDLNAFDEFLSGRALMNANEGASMLAAVPHLERAVLLDASYVTARLWLIDAYTRVSLADTRQKESALRKQSEMIDQVVKLLPSSPEASLALSYRAALSTDLPNLERLLQEALRVPGASGIRARLRYGQFLLGVGSVARGVKELEQVRQSDPLDAFSRTNLLMAYDVAGDKDRADKEMQQLLKLKGGTTASVLGTAISRAQGQHDVTALQNAFSAFNAATGMPSPEEARFEMLLVKDPAQARMDLRQQAGTQAKDNIFSATRTAQWAAYLGDHELALSELKNLHEQNFSFETVAFILWRPVMRDLRAEPAFKELLRDMGIARYWRATGNWSEFCKPAGTSDFQCH